MNNFSTFQTIFKQLITKKDILSILLTHGYVDPARKFTVSDLIDFFAQAATLHWKSFRHGCDVLDCVNFSTVSKL